MPYRKYFSLVRGTLRRVMLGATAYVLVAALMACSDVAVGDLTLPPSESPDAYWDLDLNYHAINLSVSEPDDTVRLQATPLSFAKTPLTGVSGTLVYTVSDPASLEITADGLLTAKAVVSDAFIIARMTVGTVTHTDTAFVRTFPSAPVSPLREISVQPPPGDSAIWAAGLLVKDITPSATAIDGTPIFGLAISYTSSDVRIAFYDPEQGGLSAGKRGKVMIGVSTYAFGVYSADSVEYTIQWPLVQMVGIGERAAAPPTTGKRTFFGPDTTVIGVGGTVVWSSIAGATRSVGVIFDDSTEAHVPPPPYDAFFGADSGNIPPVATGTFFGPARSFTRPGFHVFHDDLGQAMGVIDVRENDQ